MIRETLRKSAHLLAIASIAALLTGCITGSRMTTVQLGNTPEGEKEVVGMEERVNVTGWFNNAVIQGLSSTASITNGNWQARRALDSGETSGNADLINALGGFGSQIGKGVAEGISAGANPAN